MRLLVVEDELKMAGLLVRGLREDGHAVDVARTGDDALWMGQAVEYDAVVLDLMLPGLDGVSVCRAWRENGVWTPVLMLTARDWRRGSRRRARRRRRRLSPEAVLVRGAERSAARARTQRRLGAAGCRRGWGSATRSGDAAGLARGCRDPALDEGVRAPRHADASCGARALAAAVARARVGLRLREPLERRGCLHPVPPGEGRSTVRPGVDRDRPRGRIPAAEGRLGRESLADSGTAHARLRRRHDGCARGARGVSLPAARLDARRASERAAAGSQRRVGLGCGGRRDARRGSSIRRRRGRSGAGDRFGRIDHRGIWLPGAFPASHRRRAGACTRRADRHRADCRGQRWGLRAGSARRGTRRR